MRSIHVMLLSTIVLWALNLTVSKYVLTNGFLPLAYSSLRYGAAAAIFAGIALVFERTLRIAPRDLPLVALAAGTLWVNQVAFVYALRLTTASTVGLIFGATTIFAALIGLAVGTERLHRRFWLGATVSFAGVALVATGAGAELSGDLAGNALALVTVFSWAVYSVAVMPLIRRYSPSRISAVVLGLAWAGIAATGAVTGQVADQDLGLGWTVWGLVAFATLGPLVLTNVFWYRILHRIGPSRATLAVNLQPFVAAVFALVLLSERMTLPQAAGGVLIGAGILLARRRRAAPVVPAAE